MNATDDFIAAVERATGRQGRRVGRETRLLCPAHDDTSPSLDVRAGEDGWPLTQCRSRGCTFEAICEAIGLEVGDLRDASPGRNGDRRIVETYDYVDEQGELISQAVRFEPKSFAQRRPDGAGGFAWKLGDTRRVLYRLPRVAEAVASGETVYVVEGEKDVAALERLGLVATTNAMGAGKWRPEYAESLRGAGQVVIVPDDDEPGRSHAEEVARSLAGTVADVRIVELWPRGESGADVSDWVDRARNDEERSQARQLLDDIVTRTPSFGGDETADPFALPLEEFIAAKSDAPPALVGDADDNIVPTAGLTLLVGRGGKGKTTLTIDAALHFASGVDWLGFNVGRPLRILFIENEGPREPFRSKLELKRRLWDHDLAGAIFIYTEGWGAFTLTTPETRLRLRDFIEREHIDLVIGDPLDTLGLDGVGSPEDTRAFVTLLVEVGLGRDVAFWLLHHPRKEKTEDELDEAAGAWGGKPDTMLRIDVKDGNRARLSFPKVRWSRHGKRNAYILAFDPDRETFTVVDEEQDERDLAGEIEALFADGTWRTVKEIAAKKTDGGIGADAALVKNVLEANPDRFELRTGDAAVAVGRSASANLWQVKSPLTTPTTPRIFGGGEEAGEVLHSPYRGSSLPTSPPLETAELNEGPATPTADEVDCG